MRRTYKDYYYSELTLNMETGEVISLSKVPYEGPWELALGWGGSSSSDKESATSDTQFAQALQNEQNTTFAGQQGALNTVTNAMNPIIQAGPYQYGFSTAEDQALQGNIENQGATATANSIAAQQLREQQQTGGASVLPTGAQEATETAARELGAQSTATALGNEKLAGYAQGNANFQNAAKSLTDVAQIENPEGMASATNNANQNTLAANKAVDAANANSLGSKLLGGAISAGLNLATGGVSSLISGAGNLTSTFSPGGPSVNGVNPYNTMGEYQPSSAPVVTTLTPPA